MLRAQKRCAASVYLLLCTSYAAETFQGAPMGSLGVGVSEIRHRMRPIACNITGSAEALPGDAAVVFVVVGAIFAAGGGWG